MSGSNPKLANPWTRRVPLAVCMMAVALGLGGLWMTYRAVDGLATVQESSAEMEAHKQQATLGLWVGGVSVLVLAIAGVLLWRQAAVPEPPPPSEPKDQLSTLGKMSAVLAHEIRNPLASLKGHAQLLSERLGNDHAEARKVRRIVSEAQRLEKLTTNLLDFVRTGTLHRRQDNPVHMVEELRQELAGGRIVIHGNNAPERWSFDRRNLRQAVGNLLRNALQASTDASVEIPLDGPRVDVTVAAGNRHLVITVRDHGPGLPADQGDTIFEPFVTHRSRGTGLGLAVARRIVELHGGTLTGQNAEDGGAVFMMHIPEA